MAAQKAASAKKTTKKPGARRKTRARGLVEKQTALVNKLLKNIEERIEAKELKATLGDFIRLMQMQKELDDGQPREIKVTWVETPEPTFAPEV